MYLFYFLIPHPYLDICMRVWFTYFWFYYYYYKIFLKSIISRTNIQLWDRGHISLISCKNTHINKWNPSGNLLQNIVYGKFYIQKFMIYINVYVCVYQKIDICFSNIVKLFFTPRWNFTILMWGVIVEIRAR